LEKYDMFTNIDESPIYPILNPRSIATWGASNNLASMGTSQLLSIKALGFEGKIYPVHPKEDQVQGFKAYRSVFDLPEVPDMALLVLPTKIVPQILEECGQKGINSVIVVSGGFKEVRGDGIDLEKSLVETAEKYGIRFLGPNCIGVINTHHNLNTTFLPYKSTAGFIGMASQSGSFITQMSDYLSNFGLGFSVGISVGNEASIDIVDCLQYMAACPHTKVIALYIEAIRRGKEFIETARAVAPEKPIVAYYVGGSEAGGRAGFSHTGALAGPDRLYDGIFRQSGVIRAESIEEMFDFCWALGGTYNPAGNRIIVQTHSGGPGAVAADASSRAGLELPKLSAETCERLRPMIPHTGSIDNPIDLTFSRNQQDYMLGIPQVLMEEKDSDGLLVYFLIPTERVAATLIQMGIPEDKVEKEVVGVIRELAKIVGQLVEKHKKPLVGYTFRPRRDLFIRLLQENGVVVLPSATRAARAMGALVKYVKYRNRLTGVDQKG
jgi:acyl-CoA synthetase (NDP forming)